MMMSEHTSRQKQDPLVATRAKRMVIVLGRTREVELKPLIDRAWREGVPLVIINLGFPLTPTQQEVVEAGLAAAGTGAIALDAMIAYDAQQAVSFLHQNDEVIFATSRGEHRKVVRARLNQNRGLP